MLPIRDLLYQKADNSAFLGEMTQKLRFDLPMFDPLIGDCFSVEKGYLVGEPGELRYDREVKIVNR